MKLDSPEKRSDILEIWAANLTVDVTIAFGFWLLYGEKSQSSAAIIFNHPHIFFK